MTRPRVYVVASRCDSAPRRGTLPSDLGRPATGYLPRRLSRTTFFRGRQGDRQGERDETRFAIDFGKHDIEARRTRSATSILGPRAGPRTLSARTNRELGDGRVGGLVNVAFTVEPTNHSRIIKSTHPTIGRWKSQKAAPAVSATGRPVKPFPTNGHRRDTAMLPP